MALTTEQSKVVSTVLHPNSHLIKVEACAGAGKTHTLIETAKALNPKSGIYLAYNKAIADEATAKFEGTNIKCSTIHSLAYRAIVRQWGLKIGWFNARDVHAPDLDYKGKKEIVAILEAFLSSKYTSTEVFFGEEEIEERDAALVQYYLDQMAEGAIDSPHSFYLKMYHVLLATRAIPAPKTELLMLDEFGDITAITLDIFNIIEADKKIAVGDSMQNIYSFNNTVNGFAALDGIGSTVRLTQSFRVSDIIASRIQGFVRKHIDKDFEFQGREYPADAKAVTKGYVARTNAGLLQEMLRLQKDNVAFHTTRKIDLILELPLILANLGNGKRIENNKFKVIERLRTAWEKANKRNDVAFLLKHPSPLKYVLKELHGDREVSAGAEVVLTTGPREINALAKYVKDCIKIDTGLTLTTAHSSKGLEFDAVEISPDFNETMADALDDLKEARLLQKEEDIKAAEEEVRLYYVACSRALIKLDNAKLLPRAMIKG